MKTLAVLDGKWSLYIAPNKEVKSLGLVGKTENELKEAGISRIDGTVPGNFELDFRDGEIRFKVFCRSGDTILSDSQITDAIVTPLIQFDTYGDPLLSVLFGWKTPEEAIQEAEAN